MMERSSKDVKKILVKLGPTWIVYPDDVTEMLREKYVDGETEVTFSLDVGGPNPKTAIQKYKINFTDMQQINDYSGKSRKIRLVKDGEGVENEDKMQVMEGKLVVGNPPEKNKTLTFDADSGSSKKQPPPKKPDADDAEEKKAKNNSRLERERLQCEKDELRVRKRIEQDQKNRERVESERLKRLNRPPKYKIVFASQVRSDAIRLALLIGDIPFEDVFTQNKEYKGYSVNGLLILHEKEDKSFVSRSGVASLRFIGSKLKLYPIMINEMARVDEALGDLQNFQQSYIKCKNQDETDKLVAHSLREWEDRLLTSRGEWLFGERMSIADLELVAIIEWLVTRRDNINKDMFKEAFPTLMTLRSTVNNNKKVAAYIADRKAERKAQRAQITDTASMNSVRTVGTNKTMKSKVGDDW